MSSEPAMPAEAAAPVEAARSLGRELEARAPEIEAERTLPRDVVERLIDLGVFRQWVARAYGGEQGGVLDGLGVIEELAYWNGALGWCAMIGATTSLLSGDLPQEWGREIYGSPRGVTGGVAAPNGRAQRVEGGLEASGQWPWGSGSRHCDWLVGGCLVKNGADERPQVLTVFFEAAQVELLDTWFVHGLSGTGSTDFRVDGAFVPEGRWVVLGSAPTVDEALYRMPRFGMLALGVTFVTLGLARRALDELRSLAAGKRYQGSRRTLAERPMVQADWARAEAGVRAARALLGEAIAAAEAEAAEGPVSVEARRRLRMAATHGTAAAREAVDRCYHAAGGPAVYSTSPLQRVFRDLHVATQHGMVAPRTWELVGRLGLGLDTDVGQL
jgi:alkylation response protein AidB-like acyl-CoA dehydrogenase